MKKEARHSFKRGGKRFLTLGLSLTGLRCVVVGGGRVGARRALALAEHGARVTVFSPDIDRTLARAVARGKIDWTAGRAAPARIGSAALVVAASNDPALNRAIGAACERRGILCCVASEGRSGRVIFPALCRAGGLTVAVHSNGRDPAASVRLRNWIAASLRMPRRVRKQGKTA
jgi:precorrin-2 dehydrogenase / sirohydrochlorin ferrochelatase